MSFYLITLVSNVKLGGLVSKASIYRIYQTRNKTGYNVFCSSYFPRRYPWPRKKLTRRVLDEYFYLPTFCKSVEANDIDELMIKLNRHSYIYKVVI